MIQQAVDTFGGLDVLINNAGILRDKMSFNMDESEWDQVIDVHLKGHFATSCFAASYWRSVSKETGAPVNGKIVNTASESGLYGNAGQANYAAAKAGIASMTIVMARELERIGVRVNAICPVARTRLTEPSPPRLHGSEGRRVRPLRPGEHLCGRVLARLGPVGGRDGPGREGHGWPVQLVRGWRPITEATDDKPWTIESIDAVSGTLFAKTGKSVPPFMPNVGDN